MMQISRSNVTDAEKLSSRSSNLVTQLRLKLKESEAQLSYDDLKLNTSEDETLWSNKSELAAILAPRNPSK
jgi:hypothetical protein